MNIKMDRHNIVITRVGTRLNSLIRTRRVFIRTIRPTAKNVRVLCVCLGGKKKQKKKKQYKHFRL